MKIPEQFKQKLRKKEERERKERLKEREEEKEYERKIRELNRKDKKLYPKKLELARKIFQWKKEFLETEEGNKIMKRAENHLWVYNGRWGHEHPRFSGYGCWSRIYFNKKTMEYMRGYKIGGGTMFTFRKPEEMAEKLFHEYLEKMWKELETGKVFKWLCK
ncbi:MAG: hypothetical protein ABIG89_07105 [Candidatus Woesearchaeota archaeon]